MYIFLAMMSMSYGTKDALCMLLIIAMYRSLHVRIVQFYDCARLMGIQEKLYF